MLTCASLWVPIQASELAASIRQYRRRWGIEVFFVDHARLIDSPGKEERLRVGLTARTLDSLSKSEDVAIFLLTHLSRPTDINERPTMIKLKESGDLEAFADVVLLPYFPVDTDGHFVPKGARNHYWQEP